MPDKVSKTGHNIGIGRSDINVKKTRGRYGKEGRRFPSLIPTTDGIKYIGGNTWQT